MWLKAQQARWILEHRLRVWLRKAAAIKQVKKHLGMTTAHIGVALSLDRTVTKIAPAIDRRFG